MRLTKLDFVERVGESAFRAILAASRESVDMEALIKPIDWATPEADYTSIDTADPRVQKLRELEPGLVAAGIVSAGWADSVLGDTQQAETQHQY